MLGGEEKVGSLNWWWFQIQNQAPSISNRSPWLLSTLSELDQKTKAMLKLIEQDADSFSQCAEIYYNKRPQLISMVQDFYRTHCSLAESYDRIKYENGYHLSTTFSCPYVFTKNQLSMQEKAIDMCDVVNLDESEVVDPDDSRSRSDELTSLREELERLREENIALKKETMRKDETKRDVIRQLSLGMNLLMEENMELGKCLQSI